MQMSPSTCLELYPMPESITLEWPVESGYGSPVITRTQLDRLASEGLIDYCYDVGDNIEAYPVVGRSVDIRMILK